MKINEEIFAASRSLHFTHVPPKIPCKNLLSFSFHFSVSFFSLPQGEGSFNEEQIPALRVENPLWNFLFSFDLLRFTFLLTKEISHEQ